MSSWKILRKPGVTLAEIMRIASSSFYAETSQMHAMEMVLRRSAVSTEMCDALATIINVSGYKPARIRTTAAEKLLASPFAENKHLARILLKCRGELQERAARKMIENGNLTDLQRKWLGTYTPDLVGETDTEAKRFDRVVHEVLAP